MIYKNKLKLILKIILFIILLPVFIIASILLLTAKKKIQITPTFKIIDLKEVDIQNLNDAIQEGRNILNKK